MKHYSINHLYRSILQIPVIFLTVDFMPSNSISDMCWILDVHNKKAI
jgi:hypothetical protein